VHVGSGIPVGGRAAVSIQTRLTSLEGVAVMTSVVLPPVGVVRGPNGVHWGGGVVDGVVAEGADRMRRRQPAQQHLT
jgi:hypothetical protein